MSTSKPRITITLEPRVYEVLRRLSAANGESMSSVVTGFLDVAVPPMERMVVVMEQANAMPAKTKGEVRDSLLRAEAVLLPAMSSVTAQADWVLGEVLKKANPAALQAAEPRRKRTGARLSTPVPVTRGSGRTKAAKKGGQRGGL